MSFIHKQTLPVVCKNPLRMNVPHYILESASEIGKYFDRLQYCGICRAVAFTDNTQPTNPSPVKRANAYSDSKINPSSGPCSCDTL